MLTDKQHLHLVNTCLKFGEILASKTLSISLLPPVCFIPHGISHVKSSKCAGVLAAPKWMLIPFEPVITISQSAFKLLVKDYFR